jgi:ribonuclease T1
VTSRRRITFALVGLLVLVLGGWLVKDLAPGSPQNAASQPTTTVSAPSGMQVKALSKLPAEATTTWKLIQKGGPFPYPDNDGVVFGNYEKRLPQNKVGYYHEYTVDTPNAKNRATRRLITGSQRELYYTDDHYDSFVVVDPTR